MKKLIIVLGCLLGVTHVSGKPFDYLRGKGFGFFTNKYMSKPSMTVKIKYKPSLEYKMMKEVMDLGNKIERDRFKWKPVKTFDDVEESAKIVFTNVCDRVNYGQAFSHIKDQKKRIEAVIGKTSESIR